MTNHMNMSSGRPTLAPLWTSDQRFGRFSTATFRTAQGPLLSPSPMSPKTLPHPMCSTSHEELLRKKDQALVGSLSSSSLSSPKSLTPIEGQSPLVSKLEQVSLHLTDADKRRLPISPLVDQGYPNTVRADIKPHQGNDDRLKTAVAFVIARSIRRKSIAVDGASSESSHRQKEIPESNVPGRLTIRAIIRPKSPTRQTFLIQRTLNTGEARATVPASAGQKSPQVASPLRGNRTPLPVPAKWSSSSRRPSLGLPRPQAGRPSNFLAYSADYDKLVNDPSAVPIYPQYAASALPALATLLTSGHVRTGDVIYLPVPHAESWPQTVRYVYAGQGELTAAVRENIAYLGGRV